MPPFCFMITVEVMSWIKWRGFEVTDSNKPSDCAGGSMPGAVKSIQHSHATESKWIPHDFSGSNRTL